MSRVIVKGLPKGIKEERLRSVFEEVGTVTDLSLKFTKAGVFRRFAFVGFKLEENASAAVKLLNRSFIDTSRITVELAKNFGDASKPRAWSKYSRDSSAYQKMMAKLEGKEERKTNKQDIASKKEKNREEKVNELLGDLKDDEEFQEFLEVHKSKTNKATWSNDGGVTVNPSTKGTDKEAVVFDESDADSDEDEVTGQINEDNDGGSEGNGEEEGEERSEEEAKGDRSKAEKTSKIAKEKDISDLDYLKSKVTKKSTHLSDSSDSELGLSDSDNESTVTMKGNRGKRTKMKSSGEPPEESDEEEERSSSEGDDDSEEEEEQGTDGSKRPEPMQQEPDVTHVIKMKGLTANIKEKQIAEFFAPLKIQKIKIPRNAKGKNTNCVATVEFTTNKDTDQAMRKNKNFIGPKRIFLYKVKREVKEMPAEKPRPWENKKEANDEEEETIAESGRLYVRNLSYVCKEEDLETHFGQFGPLTEVHLPIDSVTRKVKGFGFVTYMIPEHAVKAYTQLDGTAFQGRMMHILPAKAKKEEDEELADGMSFKKKKEKQQKQQAGSSHNWNTLFLGANAVADVMAEKYGTTKSQILDDSGRKSLGVRMALGETQIVAETRQFLLDNGVSLDAFSQAGASRSKTVMLVKNLPAGVQSDELRAIFSQYGKISRLVLPPSGITAIVEFEEPTEARSGFRNLAYTKFQHVPLYLEWAPVDAFIKPAEKDQQTEGSEPKPMDTDGDIGKKAEEGEEDEDMSDDEVEPGSTLFVKNLNFETTDEKLKEYFATCGPIRQVTIAKKKDMKNPGKLLSMGYGFIEFRKRAHSQKALKTLQHSRLDGHQVELKTSNKTTATPATSKKKQDPMKKQTSTKILVRNIPFEAKAKEIRELFGTFGELKTVRLPKKLGGTGSHRGFCFVDFLTKQDAKRAFNTLCHSTHLYGRRLVLEWAEAEESVEQLRKKTAEHFHDEGPSKRLKKSHLMQELKLS